MPPQRRGRMDDRQPSLDLPSGITRNLANTTTPKLINTTAATPRQPLTPATGPGHRQNSSNRRLDRPRSFMDDRAVSLRLARQRRLTDGPPLALFAVIDESAVHRGIGGKEVMSDQLRHLIAMSQLPTVDLRVLPFGAREHPLLGTPLAILEFRDAPELDMVYVEQFRGTHHFIRRQAEVTQCKEEFDELTTRCLDQRQTVELIKG